MVYSEDTWLSCGIYAFVNKRSGRMYVGQTGSTLRRRWHLHIGFLTRGKHHCAPLQWDWIFLGPDAFEFRILEIYPQRVISDWLLWRESVQMERAPLLYNVHMPAEQVRNGSVLTREQRNYLGEVTRPASTLDEWSQFICLVDQSRS